MQRHYQKSIPVLAVFEPNPRQQGLKHDDRAILVGVCVVFEPNPRQQGLKQSPLAVVTTPRRVFEPNPRQQGLKLVNHHTGRRPVKSL